MRFPTSNAGIYSTWGTTNWDFGTSVEYPELKDFDGVQPQSTDTTIDYDHDDDGLISILNLAQLNAMRWDRDGDGTGSDANYAAAFPSAAAGMGCNEDEDAANDQVCTGYELTADLDMDTNGSNTADSGDTYWNGGKGWAPIGHGTGTSAYNADFDGNGHTISNLFISNATATTSAGLFGYTGPDAVIKNLGLKDVNLSHGNHVGAIVGTNGGTIETSYASGLVAQPASGLGKHAGGLVGTNTGDIKTSYSIVAVTNSSVGYVGGLSRRERWRQHRGQLRHGKRADTWRRQREERRAGRPE